jgi:phenylacetate-CoA ligase
MTRFYNRQMETLSQQEIRELQLKGVRDLLERVYRDSPFYRTRLQRAKVKPDDIKSLEAFSGRVPFMSKKDLVEDQDDNPPFGHRLPVPESEIRQVHITSGTSGRGQEVYALTAEDVLMAADSFGYQLTAADFQPGDISAMLWPVATMAGGLIAAESLRYHKANGMLLYMFDSKTKLNLMKRFNVHSFWATPAYLTRLTVLCEEMGIDPRRDMPRLKAIVLSTEPFPVDWALRMQEFWGCTLYDLYGSSQFGMAYAYSCDEGVVPKGKRGVYHLLDHLVLVEVLDPITGEPVKYGEEGEPVITTFSRRGCPIIRFRQGDRVRLLPPESCDCGRATNCWESGTISRYDDMIKMKGVNVWPAAIDEVIFSRPEIDEYSGRVFIDEQGREQVSIRLEFSQKVRDQALKQRILASLPVELHDRTGIHMDVEEVSYGTLPRFDYKSRRWTDERISGLQQVRFVER